MKETVEVVKVFYEARNELEGEYVSTFRKFLM